MSVRASRRARCAHRTNPYKRECDFCRSAASCSACRATADCEECTASARCGACRNVYSRLRRESGYSSTRLVPHSSWPASSPLLGPAPARDVLDVPRTRSGLGTYYRLLATTTPAVTHSGGRWLFEDCFHKLSRPCCTTSQSESCTLEAPLRRMVRCDLCTLRLLWGPWRCGMRAGAHSPPPSMSSDSFDTLPWSWLVRRGSCKQCVRAYSCLSLNLNCGCRIILLYLVLLTCGFITVHG